MPFQSEKQRRWMYANKPAMAKRWAKDYADGGCVNYASAGTRVWETISDFKFADDLSLPSHFYDVTGTLSRSIAVQLHRAGMRSLSGDKDALLDSSAFKELLIGTKGNKEEITEVLEEADVVAKAEPGTELVGPGGELQEPMENLIDNFKSILDNDFTPKEAWEVLTLQGRGMDLDFNRGGAINMADGGCVYASDGFGVPVNKRHTSPSAAAIELARQDAIEGELGHRGAIDEAYGLDITSENSKKWKMYEDWKKFKRRGVKPVADMTFDQYYGLMKDYSTHSNVISIRPSSILDFVPFAGDVLAYEDVMRELDKENPDWTMIGLTVGFAALTTIPWLAPFKGAIRSALHKIPKIRRAKETGLSDKQIDELQAHANATGQEVCLPAPANRGLVTYASSGTRICFKPATQEAYENFKRDLFKGADELSDAVRQTATSFILDSKGLRVKDALSDAARRFGEGSEEYEAIQSILTKAELDAQVTQPGLSKIEPDIYVIEDNLKVRPFTQPEFDEAVANGEIFGYHTDGTRKYIPEFAHGTVTETEETPEAIRDAIVTQGDDVVGTPRDSLISPNKADGVKKPDYQGTGQDHRFSQPSTSGDASKDTSTLVDRPARNKDTFSLPRGVITETGGGKIHIRADLLPKDIKDLAGFIAKKVNQMQPASARSEIAAEAIVDLHFEFPNFDSNKGSKTTWAGYIIQSAKNRVNKLFKVDFTTDSLSKVIGENGATLQDVLEAPYRGHNAATQAIQKLHSTLPDDERLMLDFILDKVEAQSGKTTRRGRVTKVPSDSAFRAAQGWSRRTFEALRDSVLKKVEDAVNNLDVDSFKPEFNKPRATNEFEGSTGSMFTEGGLYKPMNDQVNVDDATWNFEWRNENRENYPSADILPDWYPKPRNRGGKVRNMADGGLV